MLDVHTQSAYGLYTYIPEYTLFECVIVSVHSTVVLAVNLLFTTDIRNDLSNGN